MSYPQAWCVKCREHTDTQNKHTVVLANSARALTGVCPDCASQVYKILPKKKQKTATISAPAFNTHPTSYDVTGEYNNKAFCVSCQSHTLMHDAKGVILENGTKAAKGYCQECQSQVYKILPARINPVRKSPVNTAAVLCSCIPTASEFFMGLFFLATIGCSAVLIISLQV